MGVIIPILSDIAKLPKNIWRAFVRNPKQGLISFTTFIAGAYFFLHYLIPEEVNGYKFGRYYDDVLKAFQIISFMAIGLGIINILQVHGGRMVRARAGWINSAILIFGMLLTLFIEFSNVRLAESASVEWRNLQMLADFGLRIEKDYTENVITQVSPHARTKLLATSLKTELDGLQSKQSYIRLPDNPTEKDRLDFNLLSSTLSQSINSALALSEAYKQSFARQIGKPTEQSEQISQLTKGFAEQLSQVVPIAQDFSLKNLEATKSSRASRFLSKAFYEPLGSAMFSLLAFYIANAAYRAFRVKSVESLVMMLTAIIMLLGQIPHGPMYISEDLPALRLWLLKCLSTPAFRAIYFGAAIAGLAMAVRMWLSLEKNVLAQDDEGSEGAK